jgi:phospholipid/cholesterol/gamma-HCH transport system substrate-binding protein
MRKAIGATAVVVAVVVLAIVLFSGGGSGNGYVVRGIFDNGAFMVRGEQVRVAGANVGEIESVGVTMPGEIDSYKGGKPQAVPGKAVIAMKITNPGFQDFRSDASCLIRPQSLIGEKFVDCQPTLPRAPGSKPPPPLKQIPSGEPGAGQYLLPLENNSTSVDPDLINDIQSLPYAQRFRLILNELGGALAGRGTDIEEAVKRANPVLRDADRLFAILTAQRKQLAQLSSDSEQILRPWARERAHFVGFLANAGAAGQASAERGEALEASLSKFPHFLHEFRLTMRSLKTFSDAAAPVFSDFNEASPAFTEATQALAPFADASTVALKSLGNAGEASGPIFRAADPVVRKASALARSGVSPTSNLSKFFVTTKQTGGWDGLVELIYNGAGAVNQYDQYGHFVQSLVTLTNCTDYELHPECGASAKFTGPGAAELSAFNPEAILQQIHEQEAELSGGTAATSSSSAPSGQVSPSAPVNPEPSLGEGEKLGPAEPATTPAQRALLNYLLAP